MPIVDPRSEDPERPDTQQCFFVAIPACVSHVRQDRLHATCEREVSGREVLLFRSDEQQRELPVSLLVWRVPGCVVSAPSCSSYPRGG